MPIVRAYSAAGSPIIQATTEKPSDADAGLVTRPILPKSAFGELKVENSVPIVQMTAVYGVTDKQEAFTSLGGTATAASGMFEVTSGTNANGFGALTSKRQAKYRSGQGMLAKFTALFDTPQADSGQLAGLTNNTDQIGFGYEGLEFGIIYNHGGESEVQELTLTSPATGSENAAIVIDGDAYAVPVTAGTVQHNAFEMANSLNAQVPLWDFSSNNDQVVARALIAREYTGAFTLVGATVVGTFAQDGVGSAPTETIIKQADWNVRTRDDLVPANGNVYQVQFQYLGFGGLFFSIENPSTGEFEIVHAIEYANSNTVPNLSNPTFRVGWSVRNTGNTTSLTVKGGSGSMFNEGIIVVGETPRTVNNTQTSVTTSDFTNILTFKNRLVFNGKRNRVETEPFIVTVITDSAKGALIQITKDSVPTDEFTYTYVDKENSTSEIATNSTIVTGGVSTVSFIATTAGFKVDLNELGLFLFPGESFTLAAKIVSGSPSSVTATITSVEDQ